MNYALTSEIMANRATAVETIVTWIEWLKADSRTNGKVGVVGWSFGAGWAIEASINMPVDATVVYVGLIFPAATRFARLKGPVMVHLAERDYEVTKSDSVTFENIMADAGKSVEVHWYPGDHYFPFHSHPNYVKEQAEAAWIRTTQFLRGNLQ
jgi:carboxymethylenebutenolidase